VLGGGQDPPRGRGNFGGVSWPTVSIGNMVCLVDIHSMQSRVYEMVDHLSICLFVCPINRQQRLCAAQHYADRRRRLLAGAATQRTAANADSVILTARG